MVAHEPSVTGILIDLDGTLLDHETAAARAVADWSHTVRDWSGSDDDAIGLWRLLEAQHFGQFEAGVCSFTEQRRRRVRGFSPSLSGVTDAEADAAFAGYLARYEANWLAFPDAAPFVERALSAGVPVGVLTNGDQRQQAAKLDRIGVSRPPVKLFASSALGFAKPDRRSFRLACAGLGTRPSSTVMIGDDYTKDVLAARAAGLQTIHLDRRPGPLAAGSVGSLTELLDLRFVRP